MIIVDRMIRPNYPDWVRKVMNPKEECKGPSAYNILNVEHLEHEGQINGDITGNIIYSWLKKTGIIYSCLNLQDGLAIYEKGVEFFEEFLWKKFGKGHDYPFNPNDFQLILWKSVVEDKQGDLQVPYLQLYEGNVSLHWRFLESNFIYKPFAEFGRQFTSALLFVDMSNTKNITDKNELINLIKGKLNKYKFTNFSFPYLSLREFVQVLNVEDLSDELLYEASIKIDAYENAREQEEEAEWNSLYGGNDSGNTD